MKKQHTIAALTIFGVAMAFLEAAVVVYLRALYYPAGFLIHSVADLAALPPSILTTELWREAATITMLAAVAYLARETWRYRATAFVFLFALWDLSYYCFLYILLGWPPSFTTFDVYFLIPRPWVGPVGFPITLFIILGVWAWFALTKKHA